MKYDVVVVGAGIAGLTAALYCARQGLKTLVIGRDLGGQLSVAPEIQNFPGFKSIRGFELVSRVEEQAELYGAELTFDEVVGIEEEGGVFRVKTTTGVYECDAVILACGKAPREMGVPGEERLKGRGVSYCAVCDAALYRGRVVALVGSGGHTAESVLLLSKYASKVYWVFPGQSPGSGPAVDLALSRENVEPVPSAKPVEVRGESRVEAFVVERGGERVELRVDGVFVELGYRVKTEFLRGFVELNEKGEVVVDQLMRTSRRGVFAAGDVTSVPYKQAVIAAGQGAVAALSAYAYVMEKRGKKLGVVGDWRHLPQA